VEQLPLRSLFRVDRFGGRQEVVCRLLRWPVLGLIINVARFGLLELCIRGAAQEQTKTLPESRKNPMLVRWRKGVV